ncbi:MAG: flagellar basal body-associated FliL family protein [Edaphobacter sp.]|uniref:flagellar basal body-associated FliL family protein n=1 Tax=Edaphobacter sp. TaxID=1934404 RepID=UPI00238413A3|nr:flagellar basal body-associated FliL family protein [Edaphobacter sp.]MDE1178378.1 flagellar basal body-associated FliL family protein [Edaphobacter sp.]
MSNTPAVASNDLPIQAKVPVVSLGMAIVLGVVVSVSAVGGAGYYLIHSGKLRLQTMPPAVVSSGQKTRSIQMEPMVVNLADSTGEAYLRASIELRVADAVGETDKESKKPEEAKDKGADAAVRDTVLAVLSGETSQALLTPDGKETLKKSLKDALAERNPELKVVDLYFTEFLVQR